MGGAFATQKLLMVFVAKMAFFFVCTKKKKNNILFTNDVISLNNWALVAILLFEGNLTRLFASLTGELIGVGRFRGGGGGGGGMGGGNV